MNRKYYTFDELSVKIPDLKSFTADDIEDIIRVVDGWSAKNNLSLFQLYNTSRGVKFIFNFLDNEWSSGSFSIGVSGTMGTSGSVDSSGTCGSVGQNATCVISIPLPKPTPAKKSQPIGKITLPERPID